MRNWQILYNHCLMYTVPLSEFETLCPGKVSWDTQLCPFVLTCLACRLYAGFIASAHAHTSASSAELASTNTYCDRGQTQLLRTDVA
jgi:hypothetical protein